ncbi:hypothetical protein Ga0074812_11224 [Parafrankia irregularis]|uniref:Uncharacterized protein n=1 Tax=Parafrankia irregularis TaxID=795642 RepID=A0A0S4QPX8_9ACTN|nr:MULTISPECIES: hypothetical protein [Parafrankia]MBE3201624.1 hypothetical protein [Parafrankia sp. CH37]CUU57364.1 hypothetical protein Ga0074812_11224 [Parafrankia irregularis]
MPADSVVVRVLVVALCATVSLIVALVAGMLVRLDGASLPSAVMAGGGAFAAAMFLTLAVAGVLARGL